MGDEATGHTLRIFLAEPPTGYQEMLRHLDGELINVCELWENLYLPLFEDEKARGLLWATAPGVVDGLEFAVKSQAVLGIARMLDPASFGRHENISLKALVDATRDFAPSLTLQLEGHLGRATRAVESVVKQLRDKVIAHTDKKTAFAGDEPEIAPADVATFIEETKALLLKVNAGVFDVGWFDHRPHPHNAAQDLIGYLRLGRQKKRDLFRDTLPPDLARDFPEFEDDE